MELLLINIGNTFAQPGVWSGNAIELLPRIPTAELKPELLPAGMPIAAATVVPAIRKRFADTDIWYLSAYNQRAGVDFTQVDASTLGADRVANALALAELFPLPGISADCGTALTLEIVDADGVFSRWSDRSRTRHDAPQSRGRYGATSRNSIFHPTAGTPRQQHG